MKGFEGFVDQVDETLAVQGTATVAQLATKCKLSWSLVGYALRTLQKRGVAVQLDEKVWNSTTS